MQTYIYGNLTQKFLIKHSKMIPSYKHVKTKETKDQNAIQFK